MRAANGATLRLQDGVFANTYFDGTFTHQGQILAQDASFVEFNAATINGGSVGTAGSGRLRVTGSATFNGVNFGAGANLDAPNATSTTFSGTIKNQGTLNLNSVGNATDFIIASSGATFTGGGTVAMSNTTANRIYGQTGTTTLVNVDNTIRGSGQLGLNQLQLINSGVIQADQSQMLIIDPVAGGVANTGLLAAASGGVLHFDTGRA